MAKEAQPRTQAIFTRTFLVGTLLNFLLYVNYYMLMVTMTSYCEKTYGAGLSLAGFSASIFIMGALVARFVGGALIDRLGRGRALLLAVICLTAASCCYFPNLGLAFLLLVRFSHGFFYGIAQTAVTAAVTYGIPNEHKGEGIGYYMLSVTVGAAVGPFVGMALMQHGGFVALLGVALAVALVALVCAAGMRISLRTGSQQGARAASRVAATHSQGEACEAPEEVAVSGLDQEAQQKKTSKLVLIEPTALPISFVLALAYLAYGVAITYISGFAEEANLVAAAEFFFIAYSAAMFVARPFTGRIFDHIGDLPVMVSGYVVLALSFLLVSIAHNAVVLLIAAALMGYGVGAVQPSGLAIAVRRAPDSRVTLANSTFFMFLDVAIGVVPFIFGWMVSSVGYRGLFFAQVFVVLISACVYLVFKKKGLFTFSA